VFLAYPLRQAPGIFWFVTSIVQCYLLAPLLFWLLKKLGPRPYLFLTGLLMLLSAVAYPLAGQPYSMTHFVYRWLFLSHIILFALGMALPPVLERHPTLTGGRLRLLAATGVLVAVIHLTNSEDVLFAGSSRWLAPAFVMAAVWVCLTALGPRRLPGGLFPIGFAGTYSYSVYLFHFIYFKLLERLGWMGSSGAAAIGVALLTLPLFLAACAVAERSLNAVVDRAAALLAQWCRGSKPAAPGRTTARTKGSDAEAG
jgi:peptidoglycan/LPS O-acetylase OafA/YrhL